MHQDHINLQEAMTMDISQSIRIWGVPGLHVQDEDIPANANVQKTFVMMLPDGYLELKVQWTVEGDKMTYIGTVAEFSTLEELKEQFPNLFELEGTLIAYS